MADKDDDPVLIRAQAETEWLEQQREEIAETLTELVKELRDLRRRVSQGNAERKSDSGKLLGDLRFWLRAARDTEAELDAIRRANCGITGEYGLDLEQARSEIGCRLARLRTCCHADGVSE
ncbi:MAG: hypothetical protein JXQ89_06405 [Pelagimonas sp.]